MKEITDLRELQLIELDIMKEIDRICRKENIKYYLAGGTLLGAVRHKGFIPWDDDIDISMPRDDYDRFLKIMHNQQKGSIYKILSFEYTEGYPYPFAKVVDTRTRLVEEVGKDIPDMGVFVDVFPIDGMGDRKNHALKRLMKIIRIRSRIWEATLRPEEIKNRESSIKNKIIKNMANQIIKIIGVKRCYDHLIRYVKKVRFSEAKWIASAVGGANIEKELIEKKYFDNIIEMEFEGYAFYSPQGYKKYLTNLYDDYMELPPKDKQVASHRGRIWWK